MTKIPKQQTTWSALDFLENNEQETNAQKSELERRAELRRKLAAEQAKKQSSVTTANDKQDQEIEARREKARKEVQNRTNYEKEQQRILSQNRPLMSGQLSGTQDFIGYMLPGYSTLMFADDASKHSQLVGSAIKNRQWGAAAGNAIKVPADIAMGAVSLMPFVGAGVKAATSIEQIPSKARSFYYNEIVPRKDAVRDLSDYVRSGQKRQNFIVDANENFVFGSEKITPENDGMAYMIKDINEHASNPSDYIKTDNNGNILWIRYPMKEGNLTYYPNKNTTGFTARFPKYTDEIKYLTGEASVRPEQTNGNNMVLTSPRVDAQSLISDLIDSNIAEEVEKGYRLREALPNRIDKSVMKNFWKWTTQTTRPGSYLSGDATLYPLGNTAIETYKEKGIFPAIKTIIEGEQPLRNPYFRTGLSPDSYLALLKQGNRPEWNLSFSRQGGFSKWNNSAVDNSHIYDAWVKAQNGSTADKEAYIQLFNDWVKPYGGQPAYINQNGQIIHPHPFLNRRKQGGKLNYLNYINS